MPYPFNLGEYSRPISVATPKAQSWFDRGLAWVYGFNHEEAAICFGRAVELDPTCAMAHWGIALANGPFYNLPWSFLSQTEAETMVLNCYSSVQQALKLLDNATPVEKALIQALSQRYPSSQVVNTEECSKWDDAYADAMRAVHADFPEDLDVIALFAEAMMTRTPWKLWDIDRGEPVTGADTIETLTVLDCGLDLVLKRGCAPHPGLVHMYIHAQEMSPTPERALKAADQLFDLCPDVGHLQHMPAHIYVICGQYEDAIRVSRKAIRVDEQYVEYAGPYNFYTTNVCHDLHMMMYASMLAGQFEPAMQAAHALRNTLSSDLLSVERPHMAATLEGYHSTIMHVLVRFGRWQQIVETPLPDDPALYCVSTAMCHYARSVAHSALGQIEAAAQERDLFKTARDKVPESRFFFNNSATDILAIADAMMMGELEYRKNNYNAAFIHLETAVELNDNLYYTEPWAWMHPPRHALGALLLEQGHVKKAEQAYRVDLGIDKILARPLQHPNNVWSLHGYLECLQRTNQLGEAKKIKESLKHALALSGETITSSCYCRRDH